MFTITHKPFFLYTKQFEKSEINKKTFSHCSDKEATNTPFTTYWHGRKMGVRRIVKGRYLVSRRANS